MTQAVANNLNNLQELMTQASQVQNQIKEVKEISAVDKTADKFVDFSKVYEKQVAKESKDNNAKPISENVENDLSNLRTIADLKNNVVTLEQSNTNWADFQAILSKITAESNVETSLDLTLARDIDEIISQLKQAIDETSDETEDVVEKSDVVEEITTYITDEEIVSEGLTIEDGELIVDNGSLEKDADAKKDVTRELLAYANKDFMRKDFSNEVSEQSLITEENQTMSSLDANFDGFESLKIFDNLTADDTVKASDAKDATQNDIENILEEDILKELNVESIKAEVDASGDDSLMNSQSPQEQAVKAMLNADIEHFELKVDKAVQSQQLHHASQAKPVDVNPSKILDQITKQMESLQNSSKVNIVLNPEALGKVTIQLIKTGEGLSAQFTVANQEVRDMLMKGLDGLKETLTSQGVGVDNVTVKLNESQKSEYNADWTEQEDSRGGNKEQGRSNKEEKEKGLFEQMMAQTLEEENGNV